jgi:hypothetical protein
MSTGRLAALVSAWPLLLLANGATLVLTLGTALYHLVVNGFVRGRLQPACSPCTRYPTLVLCCSPSSFCWIGRPDAAGTGPERASFV